MKQTLIIAAVLSVPSVCNAAEPAATPVYANYFAETAAPERYLRYLGAIDAAQRVSQPGGNGQFAMQLSIRYQPLLRNADLFWDLSPISFNRVRFQVWNPNPESLPIYLRLRLVDNEKRGYLLAYMACREKRLPKANEPLAAVARPLPTSQATAAHGGWITCEARLPEDLIGVMPKGETVPTLAQLSQRAFMHLTMAFEVDRDFAGFGKPLTLVIDGLELYLDPESRPNPSR